MSWYEYYDWINISIGIGVVLIVVGPIGYYSYKYFKEISFNVLVYSIVGLFIATVIGLIVKFYTWLF